MKQLKLHNRIITTDYPAFIMGIINVNNCSFWKGSRHSGSDAFRTAMEMVKNGADILDLGAESSRPGAGYISGKEELNHLIPVIKKIRKFSDIPISIDTRKSEVMAECFKEGADILNDISALEDDPASASFASRAGIPVILMHKKGTPDVMQNQAEYKNVVEEIAEYLTKRCVYAEKEGIEACKIILDAGIGFAKKLEHNKALILSSGEILEKVKNVLGENAPEHIIMALSRKTCIGEMTGSAVEDRMAGSLAANMIAVKKGATILRVHDVKETKDMLSVYRGLYDNF